MRSRTKFPGRGFRVRFIPRLALATGAVLASLALAPPAAAADTDYRGWFAALDLALTQPNSLDQHFANNLDASTGTALFHRLTLENDAAATSRVTVGFSFGEDLGSLQVSYWGFDNDDSLTDNVAGYVLPTIFGYGYGGMTLYNYAYGVDFKATSSTKATALDVDYTRPIAAGDKFAVRWLAGLRVATYEEDQGFLGTDGIAIYAQDKHIESDAVGFRFGATAVFGFTDHFSLESGAVWSFLQADTKGRSTQSFFGVPPPDEIREASDDNIRGEIRDFDIRAVWSYGRLDYSLGYSMSSWDGLVTDPLPASEAGFIGQDSTASRGRDAISFNSVHAGITFRFGAGL
jgi:hypothetical protein